jgi:competence protein ComEA
VPSRPWLEGRPGRDRPAAGRDRPAAGRDRPAARRDEAGGVRAGPGRHRRPVPPGPALLALPAPLRRARMGAPTAAAFGMALVVVVAAAGFGVRVAWARAASSPTVLAPAGAGASAVTAASRSRPDGRSTAPVTSAATPTSTTPQGQVVVHVVGQVRRPGVVVLRVGARVKDALAAAGGATPAADLAAVNLARLVTDGEQLVVPRPGEPLTPPLGSGGQPGGAGPPGEALGPVNLNTATAQVLEELPGVGPVLAQRIIDWRTEHGRFTSVDELAEVSGIGEKMFAQLQDKVTV